MEVTSNLPVNYFTFVFTNLSNSKISSVFTSYTDLSNKVFINIQSIVKSLFDVPNGNTNNSCKIKIVINAPDGTNMFFIKDFIRGGKRTNETNQTTPPNKSIRISENIPVWSGFPVYDYFLSDSFLIEEKSLFEISNIDYRRVKGCNNVYIKFLNQKGGYSYWLFESYSEKEQNTNLGYVVHSKTNNLIDLGNLSKTDFQIYSKIPREYRDYVKDLIVSPDVYAYQNGVWKKLFMKSNSYEFDNIKKVYSTTLNLDINYRFNPSLIW
jgi:hypothetical protein